MVRTTRLIFEQKDLISSKELKELQDINDVAGNIESKPEEEQLEGFTQFGKDEFGINDLQQ